MHPVTVYPLQPQPHFQQQQQGRFQPGLQPDSFQERAQPDGQLERQYRLQTQWQQPDQYQLQQEDQLQRARTSPDVSPKKKELLPLFQRSPSAGLSDSAQPPADPAARLPETPQHELPPVPQGLDLLEVTDFTL